MRVHFRRCGAIICSLFLLPACGISGGGTLTPTVAPGAPSGLLAVPGNQRLTISWSPSAAGSSYIVFRSLTSGGPYFPISVPAQFVTATSYLDDGLVNGTSYFYVIVASNGFGQSAPSLEVKGVPGFKLISVTAGSSSLHSLAILGDRSVWAWGSNSSGQLGIGFNSGRRNTSEQILGLTEATAVAAGSEHSLALRSDGTVWAWGANDEGQLGSGAVSGPQPTPQPVPGLTGMIAVSAGAKHSLGLMSDGTVWAWGDNAWGQLGTGSAGPAVPTPAPVPGLTGVVSVAAGPFHSLALKSDGSVWAWGTNNSGQAGTGSTLPSMVAAPVKIPNLAGIVAISAGSTHNMAMNSGGSVLVWGENNQGQLGNGTSSNLSPPPVFPPSQVLLITDGIAVAAGASHCLVLRSDNTVWAWGANNGGLLGTGSSTNPLTTPAQVSNVSDITIIAAGNSHCFAMRADGVLKAWGSNSFGQIGVGVSSVSDLPELIINLTDVTAMSSYSVHTLALRSTGAVYEWGLSLSTGGQVNSPLQVSTPSPVLFTAISTGFGHQVALSTAGTVWCWGVDNRGQLGRGTTSGGSFFPLPATVLTGISRITAGANHSLAVKPDGTVWVWGENAQGQLGNLVPVVLFTATPTQLASITGVATVAARANYSLALKNDGTVWAWGVNASGQLGNGSTTPSAAPVQVLGLTGITAIAAGDNHALALKNDGTVWAWGDNRHGQLGDGNSYAVPTPVSTPVLVQNLSGVTAISAGTDHSLAVRNDGTVWAWGVNISGQLGVGDETLRSLPTQALNLTGAAGVVAGSSISYALLQDGTVWGWGNNTFAQLAFPPTTSVALPTTVSH